MTSAVFSDPEQTMIRFTDKNGAVLHVPNDPDHSVYKQVMQELTKIAPYQPPEEQSISSIKNKRGKS